MQRTIVHLDADAFFAAVEQAADPKLRGRPVAVGGEKRGIIASASYEARQFGVFTPMPTIRARRLCPNLIVLPGDFERYEQFSQWMFGYCHDFTPDVEQTSIDEGYFELTSARKSPEEIAQTIRRAIGQRLKITVSEGIGSNKLVSAIASKLIKPNAFTRVAPGDEIRFLHPLPVKWLPGVGPVTQGRLQSAGLHWIRQVAATPPDLLELLVGRQAVEMHRFAQGLDERPLIPLSGPQKSYSQQETFDRDLTDEAHVRAVLRRMADTLFARVREDRCSVRTLTVRVRYNDMEEDRAGESLKEPTALETDVYGRLDRLLGQAWRRRVSLRLVSLQLSNLYDGRFQADLWETAPGNGRYGSRLRLAEAVDALRRTHGSSVLVRGHDLQLRRAPVELLETPPSSPNELRSRKVRRDRAADGVKTLPPRTSLPRAPVSQEHRRSAREPARGSASSVATPKGSVMPLPLPLPIPLRVHSHYSFLDALLSPREIVDLATRYELPAIALTDRGNLHGAAEFVRAASDAGIKPVLGVEWVLEGHPLMLYVETSRGYANLCRLLTHQAQRRASSILRDEEERSVAARQRLPLRLQDLDGWTDGLIAVGTHPGLKDLFVGRFYQQATDRPKIGGVPMVICPPIHYAHPEDRIRFDILQSIRTRTLLREAHPEKQLGRALHFRSPARLRAFFEHHPDWLQHTVEIADRCQFSFPFGKPQFPEFEPPDGSSPRAYLRHLVMEGLEHRYGARAFRHREQVLEELGLIAAVGYEAYFLVVWDLLQACRKRGIDWITRGSAADSLVCYCLGISDVCPIRFDLYFKRFLNPERMALNKLPDIDVDFPHDRKDEVMRWVLERYGPEQSAVVGGFSTFQARSAFAEVAKVLGMAEREVRRFTEHFPWGFGGGWVPDEPAPTGERLVKRLQASPETRTLPLDEEPYRTALETAAFLDGRPRYPKMHPCGVVLSRQPMQELTPTFVSNKGLPTTHYDMDAVEAMGLIKIDILAQGGLSVMRDALIQINTRSMSGVAPDTRTGGFIGSGEPSLGERVLPYVPDPASPGSVSAGEDAPPDPVRLPLDFQDPRVWDMIASGGARAVHHIECPAMTSLCQMTQVGEIDGLIAVVSVIRPGAANESKKLAFTRRYQRREPVVYPHPSLEPCLRSTFGLVVYEEHVLQICEAFAGMSPGQADVLRRALVKQDRVRVEALRTVFFDAARLRGRDSASVVRVWEHVTGFSGYAFNRAHSTAYGVEAYQAAWLKRYYPAEFMAAVLTHGKGFYHPLVYVLECHRLGIRLLSPSVQVPGPEFQTVSNGERRDIQVPLIRMKGLTEETQDRMLATRREGPFNSLEDFFHRVQPGAEELEAMVRVGAFDGFGFSRTHQFWQVRHLLLTHRSLPESGQRWLLPPMGRDAFPAIPLEEPGLRQRLQWETDLFEFAISEHPLALFPDIAWDTYCPVARLKEYVGQTVTTCGLVVEQRTHHQITGEPMKFLTLADRTGMVESELFARTYRRHGLATVRYPVLEVEARVEPFENGCGFTLRVLRAGPPRRTGS